MKTISCPIVGPRLLQEFQYGGQVRPFADPAELSDEQWTDYLFNRDSGPGIAKEWWYHVPRGIWFVAERDVVADKFTKTYLFGSEPEVE